MGEKCYDVPQPSKRFPASRRFCRLCFIRVLEKTKQDLADLERDAQEDSGQAK